MTTTTASYKEAMPHPTLTKIIGKPTYTSLTLLFDQIIANACSVHSDGGDGQMGHARIVITAADYAEISAGNVDFDIPVKPALPNHALNASTETMYRTDNTYKNDLATWKKYYDTAAILKQQLLATVDDTYTKALKTKRWGIRTHYPTRNPCSSQWNVWKNHR